MKAKASNKMKHLLLAFSVTFLAVFFAPVPDMAVMTQLLPLYLHVGSPSILTVGNSVTLHISECDTEQRNIPELLGSRLGIGIANLGEAGEPFEESLNYAAIALQRRSIMGAVYFLSPVSLTEPSLPDLQTQLFFHLAASKHFFANDFQERISRKTLLGPIDKPDEPFQYSGVSYPAYRGIKDTYFAIEKTQMKCPENLGWDKRFVEAYYWKAYLSQPASPEYLRDLDTLQMLADERSKTLVVVLLPVDYDDIRLLNPKLEQEIRARVNSIRDSLRKERVNLLDLSNSLPADSFADRWCACGHLNESGRLEVAKQSAAAIQNLHGRAAKL